MNSKHLSTGSQCPPLDNERIRLYSMRFCPYAQRPLLVADAIGIPLDIVNCNLKQKPAWLFEKNPSAKVPTLERQGEDFCLYESLVVCEYLDDLESPTSRPKLADSNPYIKAVDRVWMENFNKPIGLYYKCVFNCTTTDMKPILDEFFLSLEPFERELQRRGNNLFSKQSLPGMLDYVIWPWFERFPVLSKLFPKDFSWESFETKYPRLKTWMEKMMTDESVMKYYLKPEIHYEYLLSSRSGAPNYELLD